MALARGLPSLIQEKLKKVVGLYEQPLPQFHTTLVHYWNEWREEQEKVEAEAASMSKALVKLQMERESKSKKTQKQMGVQLLPEQVEALMNLVQPERVQQPAPLAPPSNLVPWNNRGMQHSRDGRGRRAGPGGRLVGRCYICGRTDHWASQCPQEQNQGSEPTCYYCNGVGHMQWNCPENPDSDLNAQIRNGYRHSRPQRTPRGNMVPRNWSRPQDHY